MKNLPILMSFAALSALITPTLLFAREAQMLEFDVAIRATPPIATGQGQLDQLQPSPPSTTVGVGEQGLFGELPSVSVPTWMRKRPLKLMAASIPSLPDNSLRNCEAVRYRPNPRLSSDAERRRSQFYPLVMAIACEAGVPGHLFDALVAQESRYNPAALSPKGAVGLTQLMPETAVHLGVSNRFDIMQNLRGGARYLRTQLDEFGRYDLALGAYNAGPGRIRQYRALPPFRETISYVKTILTDVRTAMFGVILTRQHSRL